MDPNSIFPIASFKNTVFLKPLIEKSGVKNVIVGDYTYFNDFEDPSAFLTKNVLYNVGNSNTSLKIGKFCAIADGIKFIMADANHSTKGITTFPFKLFDGDWKNYLSPAKRNHKKKYKDICVGNDIWFGKDVTVMPEVSIGDGAIIGAGSVVASDVPPYSVAVGNPAKVAKYRFSEQDIEILLMISWWNWETSHIKNALNILKRGTVSELQGYADRNKL